MEPRPDNHVDKMRGLLQALAIYFVALAGILATAFEII